MSLILTESFSMFERQTGTVAQAVAAKAGIAAMFARAGYVLSAPGASNTFAVRDDPIIPSRAALVYQASAQDITNRARFWLPAVPPQGKPIIVGFSVFIPPNYVAASQYANLVLVNIGSTSSITSQAAAEAALGEVISIYGDLSLGRRNGGGKQSQTRLKIGSLNFLEFRIEMNLIRVWLDDALIFEGAYQLTKGGLEIGIYSPAEIPVANGTNWAFGNFYSLAVDEIAPNVRLGPTTRVIGRAPSSDVSADFLRPNGFPSNAAVVSQVATGADPTNTLQTEEIGARDEYNMTTANDIAQASMVHGLVSKVVAANLESTPHAIKPWVSSGSGIEGANEQNWEVAIRNVAPGVNIKSSCMREDGTIFVCGTGPSVFYSQDGGDTWQTGYNAGTAAIANDIACGPDGTVRACCSNRVLLECLGTDGPGVWTSINTLPSTESSNLLSIAVNPSNVWIITHTGGSSTQLFKNGAAAWATQSRNVAIWVDWHPGANLFVAVIENYRHTYSPTGLTGTWLTATSPQITTGARWPMCWRDGWYIFAYSGANQNYINGSKLPPGGAYTLAYYSAPRTDIFGGIAQNSMGAVCDLNTGAIVVTSTNGGIFLSWQTGDRFDPVFVPGMIPTQAYEVPNIIPGGFLVPYNDTSGNVLMLRKRSRNRALIAADGYKMHTNVCSLDPATGLPWTPVAAALSTAGMTVTR